MRGRVRLCGRNRQSENDSGDRQLEREEVWCRTRMYSVGCRGAMQCKTAFVAAEAVIYKDALNRKRAAVCVRLSSYRQAMIKKRHRGGV